MKTNKFHSIFATAAILATAVCAEVLTPRELMASANASLNLENMIPQQFGKWKYSPGVGLVTPTDPQYVEEKKAELRGSYIVRRLAAHMWTIKATLLCCSWLTAQCKTTA